ncbi:MULTISPECIES: helix-turn-helix domain-containing protein [unclassified Micromonospora]|uniref:helix-turn-helix domain-containing protein n=1 Tax=unclassified Micromonospora TaxID=2617518 RepID=UPI0033DF316B
MAARLVKTIPDLHPDDTAARYVLAHHLRTIREARSLSQADAGERFGCNEYAFSHMELRRSWLIPTVQAWARVLDSRLNLTVRGLVVPDDGDPIAALYEASQPESETAEDRLDLRIFVNNLARIRRAQGLTLAQVGTRMGCSESAVSRRESEPDRLLVSTLQRHTRALGGVLDLTVVPAWQGAAA